MQLLENQILNESLDFNLKLNPDYLDVYVPQQSSEKWNLQNHIKKSYRNEIGEYAL